MTIINSGSLPDAVFCDNDSSAIGLLRAFNAHKIKVPDQVQIIATGLGSVNYTRFTIPSISIVDVPLELLAENCLQIVEKIAKHQIDDKVHILFDSLLIRRESTKSKE